MIRNMFSKKKPSPNQNTDANSPQLQAEDLALDKKSSLIMRATQ